MLAYIKLKTNNKELYETNFLEKLKQKNTKFSKIQYGICYYFYELVVFIKYIANIITVKQIYDAYLFILPFKIKNNEANVILENEHKLKNNKVSSVKLKKCVRKIQKCIKKYNIHTIVLDEEVQENLEFINIENNNVLNLKSKNKAVNLENSNKTLNLKGNSKMSNLNGKIELKEKLKMQKENLIIDRKIKLLDGTSLMQYLIKEIIEYIIQNQNENIELEDLYICIKEMKSIYIENIEYLAKYFRSINIITPKIKMYENIANRIEENQNSIITITNNRKKSLKKAKYIVNFDFKENEINQYTIYRNATILNIEKNTNYETECFDGIQIKRIGIDFSDELKTFFKKYNLLQNCSLEALYESLINEKQRFIQIKTKLIEDKVKVVKIYGRKGEI